MDMMKSNLTDFTKRGFVRLIKPFEGSTDDLIKITRAFGIALKTHVGEFRDENKIEPYINHPLKVALVITEELPYIQCRPRMCGSSSRYDTQR